MRGNQPGAEIQWRMHIPVSPTKVFTALNSDQGRASFWAESAVEVDGQIAFQFINGWCDQSRILERRPPSLFSIRYMDSTVTFELTPDGRGGTDLLLRNSGVGVEKWHEVHAGWLNVLFPLKAWLLFGVDLRNHDPERCWERGYADQ